MSQLRRPVKRVAPEALQRRDAETQGKVGSVLAFGINWTQYLEHDAMFPCHLSDELTLELLDLRHADELFRVVDANREHLRQWLPWLDGNRTVDDTRAFIRLTQRQFADNKGFQTAIRSRGDLVGVVGYHHIDWSNRSASLGYWLAQHAQGRGIMTASCRTYIDHAFDLLKLNRMEIRCAVGNQKSRAIPERLGLTAEGTIRDAEWLYDRFVDHVVYGVLVSEWRARARASASS